MERERLTSRLSADATRVERLARAIEDALSDGEVGQAMALQLELVTLARSLRPRLDELRRLQLMHSA